MTTQANVQQHAESTLSPLAQNIATLIFGGLIIFAVGFLPMDAAHNAAHDTRHAMAFPCH